MATGKQMLDAVREKTKGLPKESVFAINPDDRDDLCKLTVPDLLSVGFDEQQVASIVEGLKQKDLSELGKALGLHFRIEMYRLNLIPGEAARRASEILKDDPQTLDEMLREFTEIRNWGRLR